MTRAELRRAARRILRKGLAAVEPGRLVRAHIGVTGGVARVAGITIRPTQKVFLVSVGKAAAPMALAAHRILGSRITSGIVIAPEKSPRLPRTRTFVAGHPVPDAAGVRAGQSVMKLLEEAGQNDLVVLLLSGGASALMPAPIEGVSLRDKQRVTRLLLRRGASITEINAVRKQLSRLKGGGFARLSAPARVVTLAISDVQGNDIKTIGSGPTVDDPLAATMARKTLSKFLAADEAPAGVRQAVKRKRTENPRSSGHKLVLIGSGRTFAKAAAGEARALGFRAHCLPDALQGEARLCGPALVRRFASSRQSRPSCLIATGETVVNVLGSGVGGRNQEVALSAVPTLARVGRPTVLAALATDGRDGNSMAAGGVVDDHTSAKAVAAGVAVNSALARNGSTAALRSLGCLIETGPTGTNVADVTIVLG